MVYMVVGLCYHYTPLIISYECREVCLSLTVFLSMYISQITFTRR